MKKGDRVNTPMGKGVIVMEKSDIPSPNSSHDFLVRLDIPTSNCYYDERGEECRGNGTCRYFFNYEIKGIYPVYEIY